MESPDTDELPRAVQLLLRLARPNESASNDAAIDRLLQEDSHDWDALIRLGRAHGAMPLIHRRLKNRPDELVPPAIRSRIQQDFQRIGLMIKLQLQVMKQLIAQFNEASIPVLFFKGLPLGQLAYGNAIWRKPGDLDILIHRQHFEPAQQILLGMGFDTRLDRAGEKKQLARQDQLTFYGKTVDVDVHFSLQQRSFLKMTYAATFDRENVWRRSTDVMVDNTPVPCLSAEDQFCLLAAHGAKHGWHLLYMLVDMAACMVNIDLNWVKIVALTKRIKAERMLGLGVLLVNILFEVPVPKQLEGLIKNDTSLPALAGQVLFRIFDDEADSKPLQFHRIQAGLFPRWAEKARYFGYVTAEHWKRKRAESE